MDFKMKISNIIIILLCFAFSKMNAQTDSSRINFERNLLDYQDIKAGIDYGDVKIISASRSAKSIKDLPVTVYVVTREEIQRNNYVTLVDVLRTVPGIKTSQVSDKNESFLLNGLEGNMYTKILINNLPVAPSVTGFLAISAQLPIRQAERIEIIFGPAAAIYGADATTGIINIITRDSEKRTFAVADVTIGENLYSYQNFMVGGKSGRDENVLKYSLYGSYMNFGAMNIVEGYDKVYNPLEYFGVRDIPIHLADGNVYHLHELTEELLESTGTEFDFELAPFYRGTLNSPTINNLPTSSILLGAEFRYKNFNFSYNYMQAKIHSSVGRTSFIYLFNNPENFYQRTTQRITLGHHFDFGNFLLESNLSLLHYRLDNRSSLGVDYRFDTQKAYVYEASDDLLFEQTLTYTPSEKFEFIFGASLQVSGNLPMTNEMATIFESDNYKPFSTQALPEIPLLGAFGFNPLVFYQAGLFMQAYYSTKKLKIVAGARYDINSLYRHAVSPRLAALYKFNEKTSVRVSSGYSFKAPPSSIIYSSIAFQVSSDIDSLSYAIIPNPDLRPEVFRSFELGFRYSFSKRVSVDVSAFSNEIKNLIFPAFIYIDREKYPRAYSLSDAGVRQYINTQKAKSVLLGLQASLRMKNIYTPINLSANFSFGYLQGAEILPDRGDNLTEISEVRQMPPLITKLNVSFSPFSRFYFNMNHVLMGSWRSRFIGNVGDTVEDIGKISGYYVLDLNMSYTISKNFTVFMKILNTFDEKYGGIDISGTDVDMLYNPQPGRNIRFGLNFTMN